MKKQNTLLQGPTIALAFFAAAFLLASCSQGSAQAPNEAGKPVAKTKQKPPSIGIHAAILTDNMAVLKQHIAAGSNLNEKDPIGGSSPLISACLFGKTEMAKALIDAGADLNFQNNDGSTALHTAAFFCRPEPVKELLAERADKTIKNKYGQTAGETVAGSFATAKNAYDMLGKMLAPMGLKLDYVYIER